MINPRSRQPVPLKYYAPVMAAVAQLLAVHRERRKLVGIGPEEGAQLSAGFVVQVGALRLDRLTEKAT
jgi:hypothetical protein